MTKEERDRAIEKLSDIYTGDYRLAEALKLAIEALKAEPCEDAVSRKAVANMAYIRYDVEGIGKWVVDLDDIRKLPSVTPETPVAHWVGIDEYPNEEWECDHCGFVIDGSGCIDPIEYRDIYKYCPNCGRKMEGEQK